MSPSADQPNATTGVVDIHGKSTLTAPKPDDIEDVLKEDESADKAKENRSKKATEAKRFVEACLPPSHITSAFVSHNDDAMKMLAADVPQQNALPLPSRLAATPAGWTHCGRTIRRVVIHGLRRVFRGKPPPRHVCAPFHTDVASRVALSGEFVFAGKFEFECWMYDMNKIVKMFKALSKLFNFTWWAFSDWLCYKIVENNIFSPKK